MHDTQDGTYREGCRLIPCDVASVGKWLPTNPYKVPPLSYGSVVHEGTELLRK